MFVGIYLFCLIGFHTVSATDYCLGHFDNCICTDESVVCHNEEKLFGDITKLFHYIQDDVTTINITGCKLGELPKSTFGSCRHDTSLVLKKLKLVNLSNNSISVIHGQSFHCAPNIETLILSDNEWEVDRGQIQTGYFSSLGSLKYLDMNNTFDEVWNGRIHLTKLAMVFNNTDMTLLETLKLGYNELFTFPPSAANSFCRLTALKNLDLSHNNFDDPSLPNKENCLENLEELDFSYNNMTVLPVEFMDKMVHLKQLKNVKLDNNPYECDCGLIETWKWLNSTTVPVNKHDLKCAGGYHSSYQNQLILSLALSDLRCNEPESSTNCVVKAVTGRCNEPESSTNCVVKAVTGILFVVAGLTLVAFLIVQREKVKLLFKKWKKRIPYMRFRSTDGYASEQKVAVISNKNVFPQHVQGEKVA